MKYTKAWFSVSYSILIFECWLTHELLIVSAQALFLDDCYFLYWDAVGYVTKPVHCLTLSRGGRADSDFGQQKANKQNFIRVSIQKVAQT